MLVVALGGDNVTVDSGSSLNETAAGWTTNWESLNVFTSWDEPKRVRQEAENFARLWADCGFQRKAARYSDLIAATIPT